MTKGQVIYTIILTDMLVFSFLVSIENKINIIEIKQYHTEQTNE